MNHSKGCDWKGPVSSLAHHQRVSCKLERRTCTNRGCTASHNHKEMLEHLPQCEYREEICQECGRVVVAHQMGDHLGWCQEIIVTCSDYCSNCCVSQGLPIGMFLFYIFILYSDFSLSFTIIQFCQIFRSR